ncbi:MAG: VanW family protein [Bacteroidales bacterium]|nr:VanW family protein [Bacteroidales bacterium]
MKLKVFLHIALRYAKDALSAHAFAKAGGAQERFPHHIDLAQPFTPSATLEAKKHNLRLAAERIERVTIMPGEVFSFWRVVGNPNTKQFCASRSIVAGKLKLEQGGGLCQASGIMYHLALMAGLDIIERFAHSVDLYTEQTRFCPLGSDATVAYGYRDLRFRNSTPSPIRFEFSVLDHSYACRLTSQQPIEPREIRFSASTLPDGRKRAIATDASTGEAISTDVYETLGQ